MPTLPRRPSESFGLFARIKSRRVILPLKGVECDFSVTTGTAEVSMTQIFRQDNEKPLDCEYLFPLPADAAVYACEADINGRTICAQVREREEARRLAAEKKAAGFRTALVEAERENLFTLGLGNIQPGDLVIVQLKYFQTLRSLAGKPSIEIPLCPGIRYIPGTPLLRGNQGRGIIDDTDEVPDASRITPVRIDAEHPDAAYLEVRGSLDGKFVEEHEVTSPSHSIAVERTGNELRLSLSGKGEVPDRDFVLRWSEKKPAEVASRAWIREKEKAAYALLEIRAPQQAPGERAPVDFYFLVDRSGSMQGEKWNKAVEALQSCVKVLEPDDRAMVTLFESHYRDFAERPLRAQQLLGVREFQELAALGTGGGTELRPALEHALAVAAKHSRKQCRNLILITDAQVGNESAILDVMKSVTDFPVHCFGVDVALNDALLLALCRQQGGTFHSLNPHDDVAAAVTALGQTLGQPVLLNLKLSDGWEPADAVIPNLYAGQIHYLSARATNGVGPVEVRALSASAEPLTVQFERQTANLEAPYLHWCRSRLQRLVAEGQERAAVALSVQSNLICPLTAFIAWDESEKVPVASHALVQPDLLSDRFGAVASQKVVNGLCDRLCSYSKTGPGPSDYVEGQFQSLLRAASREGLHSLEAALHELQLRRKLSKLCHRAGLTDWQPLVNAIFDWIVQVREVERGRRLAAVQQLFEELSALAARLDQLRKNGDPGEMAEAGKNMQQRLKEFADHLPG